MACGCKKAKDIQDKLIEIDGKIADSMNPISRTSLKFQKTVINKQESLKKSIIVTFFTRVILSILALPLMLAIFILVGVSLFIFVVISVFFRLVFNKNIGGFMSPFVMYHNIKHSFINAKFNNLKGKLRN